MAKALKNNSTTDKKQHLFQEFIRAADAAIPIIESVLDMDGIYEHFFGHASGELQVKDLKIETKLKNSLAWKALSALYDYAEDGVIGSEAAEDIVIRAAEVITCFDVENGYGVTCWDQVTMKGDSRFALDSDWDIPLEGLALLANVDVRTVRNAVSSGELESYKSQDPSRPGIYVRHAGCRKWLNSRKAFKPTTDNLPADDITQVNTSNGFAQYLQNRRNTLNIAAPWETTALLAAGISINALQGLEQGIFDLSLRTVTPLANHYQLEREAFLEMVMRVFYSDYLETLRGGL